MGSGFLGNAETLQYYNIKDISDKDVQAAESIVCYSAKGTQK